MAITGILGGMMDVQAFEQDLKDKKALADERTALAQKATLEAQTEKATMDVVSKFLSGGAPTGQQVPGQTQQPQQQLPPDQMLERLGTALMGVNPTKGAKLIEDASQMRQRAAQAGKERIDALQKQAEFLGETFQGVTDQDTYNASISKLDEAGVARPKWMTGNFETDRPFIGQAMAQSVKVKDALSLQQRALDSQQRGEHYKIQEADAQARLKESQKVHADLQAYRKEHLALEDKRLAKSQQGKAAAKSNVPSPTEFKLSDSITNGMREFDNASLDAKEEISRTAASRAHTKMLKGDERPYEAIVAEELQNIAKKEYTPGDKGFTIFGINTGFGGGKGRMQRNVPPITPTKPTAAAPAQYASPKDVAAALKAGKLTDAEAVDIIKKRFGGKVH